MKYRVHLRGCEAGNMKEGIVGGFALHTGAFVGAMAGHFVSFHLMSSLHTLQ